jgi:hypothetical protein
LAKLSSVSGWPNTTITVRPHRRRHLDHVASGAGFTPGVGSEVADDPIAIYRRRRHGDDHRHRSVNGNVLTCSALVNAHAAGVASPAAGRRQEAATLATTAFIRTRPARLADDGHHAWRARARRPPTRSDAGPRPGDADAREVPPGPMSRATIRAAMAAWLQPPAVAGINTVYRSLPKIIPGQAFFAGVTGVNSGCVAMIHVARDHREAHRHRRTPPPARSGSTTPSSSGSGTGLVKKRQHHRRRRSPRRHRRVRRHRRERSRPGSAPTALRTRQRSGSGVKPSSAAPTRRPERNRQFGVEMWCSISTVVTEWLTT